MANAQEILDQYANMNQYINWLASQQLYYRTTLNNAEMYKEAYTSMMSYGTALAGVGLNVLTSSASDALLSVADTARSTVRNEINYYYPEMTTEQFIYSQARMGVDDVERDRLFDIQNKLVDGQFTNPEDAAEFILIYQTNKASLAAAEMGKKYYYNELNKSFWDHIGSLLTNVAVCQISGLIQANIADFDTGELADDLFNMLGLVSDCYDNEYVSAWMAELRQIERETEALFDYEESGTGSGSGYVPLPTYTVTFDGNGGTAGLAQRKYTQGAALGYLPTPFRFGYDFLGWYDASGNRYTTQSVINGDLALIAHWDRIILETGNCGTNLVYVLYGDGELDITGSGDMTSHPWTSSNAKRVGEVHFPDGLTSIASSAFSGCKYLHELDIPVAVKTIGAQAFVYTGLQSLTLPAGVETLGYELLAGNTGVKELTVPGSVTSMSAYNYSSSSFRGTFTGSALEQVVFAEGITTLGSRVLCNVATLEQVELPSTLTTIQDYAFYGCTGLTEIELPEGLESIGQYAFADTGLTELDLPEGITYLGKRMLSGNEQVKELVIPNTYTSGNNILDGSAVERVVFEEGIETIPSEALAWGSALTEVVLPSTVKNIGYQAFVYTGLQSLTLPAGVETLGYELLAGNTGVKELTVPGSVTSMSAYNYSSSSFRGTFTGSALEQVVFAEGITTLGSRVLCNVATLEQVELPSTLTTIQDYAFYGCTGLTEIELPEGLESIGQYAFADTGLTELDLPEGITYLGKRMLSGNEQVKELVIPNTYTSGNNILDGSAVERVVFEEGIETIPSEALAWGSALTEVVLPSTVKNIGYQAFVYTGLQSLTLPAGVETLGYEMLAGNTGVKELTVPGSVTSMAPYNTSSSSFRGTFTGSALERVVFAEGIASLGNRVLCNVATLEQVELPNTLTDISPYAFYGCTGLSDVYYHGTQEDWEAVTVQSNNDPLAGALLHLLPVLPEPDFVMPAALTEIDDEAFAGCAFVYARLSENTTRIGDDAFAGCLNLRFVYIPQAAQDISPSAFDGVPDGLTICGIAGSDAETYANAHGFAFVAVQPGA